MVDQKVQLSRILVANPVLVLVMVFSLVMLALGTAVIQLAGGGFFRPEETKQMLVIGKALFIFGTMLITIFLLLAGILRTDFGDNTRFGLVFSAGLILMATVLKFL